MGDFVIRNYICEDANKIGVFDKVAELAYLYKKDFDSKNIFCAVNDDNQIMGVVDLEPHITWTSIDSGMDNPDYIYRLSINLRINPGYSNSEDLKSSLMDTIINRAIEIKNDYPDKRIRIIQYQQSDNIDTMNFLIDKGFVVYRTALVMKRDLGKEIDACLCMDDIEIKHWEMPEEDDLMKHVVADMESNNGAAMSFSSLSWMRFAPGWSAVSAFAGEELVGSMMMFSVGEDRSATENIFVRPKWRRQGIARAFITEGLRFLRESGLKEASLSVDGDNKSAIKLYKSLGYEADSILLELGYDI